jgi:WD40 repeat protein
MFRFDLRNYKILHEYSDHKNDFKNLNFCLSPDENFLFLGGTDGFVRCYGFF